MAIVRLPATSRRGVERSMLRRAAAISSGMGRPLHLVQPVATETFCAGCAAPVEFGAVTRGPEIFCSVECSLGGNRPA